MTRAWRVEYEGAFYHLLSRGRTLFFSARRIRIEVDVEIKIAFSARPGISLGPVKMVDSFQQNAF
jgi:hypothetical protein